MIRTRMALSEGLAQGVRYKIPIALFLLVQFNLRIKFAVYRYSGMIQCGVSVVSKEGIPALYKGIGPTWLSGAP